MIQVGDCQDNVRTGLAGKIANAIASAFSGIFTVTYPAGSNNRLGINALAQGIVDGVDSAESDNSQTGTTLGPIGIGDGWNEIPGTSSTFTPKSSTRKIRCLLTFSGEATIAAGPIQVRFVVNGSPVGSSFYFSYAAVPQRICWTAQWVLSAGGIGTVGTAYTVAAQVTVYIGTIKFSMDGQDSSSMVVEEL